MNSTRHLFPLAAATLACAVVITLCACSAGNGGSTQYAPSSTGSTPASKHFSAGHVQRALDPVAITMQNGIHVAVPYSESSNCYPPWPLQPSDGAIPQGSSVVSTQPLLNPCFSASGQFARMLVGDPAYSEQDCAIIALTVQNDLGGLVIQFSIDYAGSDTNCTLQQTGNTTATLYYNVK